MNERMIKQANERTNRQTKKTHLSDVVVYVRIPVRVPDFAVYPRANRLPWSRKVSGEGLLRSGRTKNELGGEGLLRSGLDGEGLLRSRLGGDVDFFFFFVFFSFFSLFFWRPIC